MRGTLLGLAAVVSMASSAIAQTYLVVIGGIGGESKYAESFQALGAALVEGASEQRGIARERVIYLAERDDAPRADERSTKANIEEALRRVANQAEADARVFIVLIGHGSAVGGEPRFQIPGPDITAQEFADLLSLFPTQSIVFANLSSASGDFIAILSGERRTIITATKSGYERNESIFAEHFIAALTETGADTDKDDRVSILEAFEYARLEVQRTYEQDNRLQTEHAMLDDNGDGKGSPEPGRDTADGSVAMRLFLVDLSAVAEVADSELAALLREQQALEEEWALLRARKDDMVVTEYEAELERVLLEMARVGHAIRQRQERLP